MKTKILFATVVVAAFGAAHTAAVGAKDFDAKAVNATFDRYVLGWQKGDIDLLETVYSHDGHLTAYWPDPTRPARLESWATVKENLKDVFDLIHRMDLEFDERQIDVYGSVAVLTTHWTWHHPSGRFFEHGRATFIFKKDAGKWMIVHEHSSVTPFIPGGDSEFVNAEKSN